MQRLHLYFGAKSPPRHQEEPLPGRTEPARSPPVAFQYFNNFDEVEALWRAFQKKAAATPFSQFDWQASWFNTIGRTLSLRPLIACGYHADKLVILVPLAIDNTLVGKRASWLAYNLSDYNAPLVDPAFLASMTGADVAAIWRTVAHDNPSISHFHLPKQPPTIGAIANPFAAYKAHKHSSGAHSLVLQRPWDEFYTKLRSTNTRGNLRRKEKHLAKLGDLQFTQVTGPEERRKLVKKILSWKKNQLNRRGARNPFTNRAVFDFFTLLARQKSATDLLRVFVLRVDQTPLAAALILSDKTRFLLYQTVFLPGPHMRYSPGNILLRNLIREAVETGYELFDFSLGDEHYKFDWCSDHTVLSTSIFALRPCGHLAVPVIVTRNKLIAIIKGSPFLYGLFTRLRRYFL